jgi:hypothetical protein
VPIPEVLHQIAADVQGGKQRRAKVRTLLGYYGLQRRRESGISVVRADLAALGIETEPDFATAGFDEQVRFIVRGTEAVGSATGLVSEGEDRRDFSLEPEGSTSGLPRFRVLLRTYDAFERLRSRLVDERLATVLIAGQNARREDRNQFPFHLSVELRDGCSADELEKWTSEAVALAGPADEVEPETEAAEAASGVRLSWDSKAFIDHATALHEDLRASLADQMHDLEQRLNRKVEEIRFEAVRNLAKELNTEEAMRILQEFEQEMQEKLQRRDAEVAEYVRELGLLEQRLQDYEDQALQEEYDPGDAYPTMVNTVLLFQDLCEGLPVIVHENALRSAARSASVRRREVLQFLLTLKELGETLYLRGGVGQPMKDWFASRGYEYALGDSETTSARYGKEREILLDGTIVQLEEHVTLFPNNANCVSIYFLRDDRNRRLVIGYVGPHLRTVSR